MEKHSKNFEKYRYFYHMGFYTGQMLEMLVGKCGFTEEELHEILDGGVRDA